jgi:hypothetical protein
MSKPILLPGTQVRVICDISPTSRDQGLIGSIVQEMPCVRARPEHRWYYVSFPSEKPLPSIRWFNDTEIEPVD